MRPAMTLQNASSALPAALQSTNPQDENTPAIIRSTLTQSDRWTPEQRRALDDLPHSMRRAPRQQQEREAANQAPEQALFLQQQAPQQVLPQQPNDKVGLLQKWIKCCHQFKRKSKRKLNDTEMTSKQTEEEIRTKLMRKQNKMT